MKLKSILCAAGLLMATGANAQLWLVDSVAMGPGYANDIFYNLSSSNTTIVAGGNWDLAFEMRAFGEANLNTTVRANHAKKGLEVYTLNLQASTNWATVSASDTVGKTGLLRQLINIDTSWGTGAFYQNRLVTDAYSYGWGRYSGFPDHSVDGDSLYLLRMGGQAYKIWVQKYVSNPADSISYTFRIAKLDGSNDNTVKIYRKAGGYADRLFAYYDIASNTVINREPSRSTWDILFTQYFKIIPAGPSTWMPQVFTGVLSNSALQVADVRGVEPDQASYQTASFSTKTDEIGSDWKTFNQATFLYTIEDSTSYFVKTKTSNEYYQMKFIRFDGGSPAGAGKIVFARRYLAPTAVSSIAASSVTAWAVAPNPAANEASVMIDAKKAASAQLIVTDMAGRSVQRSSVSLKEGLNGFKLNTASWPAGMYAVQVAAEGWNLSTRLVVAH